MGPSSASTKEDVNIDESGCGWPGFNFSGLMPGENQPVIRMPSKKVACHLCASGTVCDPVVGELSFALTGQRYTSPVESWNFEQPSLEASTSRLGPVLRNLPAEKIGAPLKLIKSIHTIFNANPAVESHLPKH